MPSTILKGRSWVIRLMLLVAFTVISGISHAQTLTEQPNTLIKSEIKARLQTLQNQIQAEGRSFTVRYSPAMERTIPQLCGLVEPKNWQINARYEDTGRYLSALGASSSFDWRQLQGGSTPVRDQGYCGSCWAFGTVAPLEILISYHCGTVVDLSEQYLVSCNDDGWDCGGGWFAHNYHEWDYSPTKGESDWGAVLEAHFPYVASNVSCGGSHSHPYKISDWRYVGSSYGVPTVTAIKAAIQTYGPVSAAVCVGSRFQGYGSGIFEGSESCGSDEVNHAITLVGWVDDDSVEGGYWILKNSWGSSWGENGYMKIRYGTSMVGYAANYIVFTSANCLDDPGPATPPAISVTPSSVSPGGTVTAAFSNVAAPTSTDWIGLYVQGASNSALKGWFYGSSCTASPGGARASGSCAYTVPINLSGGTYELRLFANDGYTLLASSNAFTVTGATPPTSATLTATPSSVSPGGTVTTAFSGVAAPTSTDWIGLYVQGASNSALKGWFYDSSCTYSPGTARTSGSCAFTVPTNFSAGTYEFRLFANDGYTLLASSNAFTVTGATPSPTISVTPSSVATGGTVTTTFSNVAAPTSTDWIGVYVQGASNSAYSSRFYDSSCTASPGTARTSGSCAFTVPTNFSAGTYELRLFANDGYTLLASSNAFTVTVPTPPTSAALTATPSSVSPGGTVTTAFSGVSAPTSTDWIGLYVQGASNSALKGWFYDSSCAYSPSTARASGSCVFTVPTNLPVGTYEFRLFANDGYTLLASSNSFTVTATTPSTTSLTVTPTSVTRGTRVTVSYTNPSPTTTDWIALFPEGAHDYRYGDILYFYANSCLGEPGSTPKTAGSCQLNMPNVAAGTYEFRLFSNGRITRLATSNTFLSY